MTFAAPKTGVRHSLSASGEGGESTMTVPVQSFESIRRTLKDEKVSILKIDVEGHEVVVIPQLVELFQTQASPKP